MTEISDYTRAAPVETGAHPLAVKRLNDMLALVERLDRRHAQMLTIPKSKIAALIRLGTRIVNLLPLGGRRKE
jgi:hypothetical protein